MRQVVQFLFVVYCDSKKFETMRRQAAVPTIWTAQDLHDDLNNPVGLTLSVFGLVAGLHVFRAILT